MFLFNQPEIKKVWKEALGDSFYKKRFQLGLIIWVALLIAFPFFFDFIENRNGVVFNDWIINNIPAFDLSIPTFLIIWSMFLLFLFRAIYKPELLLLFLWGFIFLSISRFITIFLFTLNPPEQLIELSDPITNIFYGKKHGFITKDLFYSGHTSTQFLMFLCFTKKTDKILSLISTILIGIFVLVQHIHYSIDVLAAPILTYYVYLLGKTTVTR